MYDLQKANMWKRISAWLFDFIVIGIIILGIACLLSLAFRYDFHYANLEASYDKYEEEYGIKLDLTPEEQEKLTEEELAIYREAGEKMQDDPQIRGCYTVVVNLVLTITSLSILLGFFATEFVVPLIFGNGQTLGKKIFGLGVMRSDGVKLSNLQLFFRAILGKCVLETLVPIFIVIMIILRVFGIVGIAVLAAILLSEIVFLAATKERTALHDFMAGTVAIDISSQLIFDTPEELMAYKTKLHRERVNAIEHDS